MDPMKCQLMKGLKRITSHDNMPTFSCPSGHVVCFVCKEEVSGGSCTCGQPILALPPPERSVTPMRTPEKKPDDPPRSRTIKKYRTVRIPLVHNDQVVFELRNDCVPVDDYVPPPILSPIEAGIRLEHLTCPEDTCGQLQHVTTIVSHFCNEHPHIILDRTLPGQVKRFCIQPKLSTADKKKVHYIFLLQNKIRGLTNNEYKDYVPIVVTTMRIQDKYKPDTSVLLVFLLGIVSDQFPLQATLTAWKRDEDEFTGYRMQEMHIMSLQNNGDAKKRDLMRRGDLMIFTKDDMDYLTDNGNHLMELSIEFD